MSADELARFNALPLAAAREKLLACCSSPAWVERMASGRPYSSARDAARQSSAILTRLSIADLHAALAGHTPYAAQSADDNMAPDDKVAAEDKIAAALTDSIREYEYRFGHVYVASVAGRTSAQQLGLVRARLRNLPDAEWQVVRLELQKINATRLHELLTGSAAA
jgi:2-oxo-4-hydroxy-4-carboxy-5-ureidoimidazoline decarboxylase